MVHSKGKKNPETNSKETQALNLLNKDSNNVLKYAQLNKNKHRQTAKQIQEKNV